MATATEKVCGAMGTRPPNVDHKTGIHYGVINQNQLASEAIEDIISRGTDEGWEEFYSDTVDAIAVTLEGVLDDFVYMTESKRESIRTNAEELFDQYGCGDGFESSGPYHYEFEGYVVSFNPEDGDLFVIKSPYFTYCRECSPCAPNAGYLTSQPGALKTYCLGRDWFDNDAAPYPYWEVDTEGAPVFVPPSSEE